MVVLNFYLNWVTDVQWQNEISRLLHSMGPVSKKDDFKTSGKIPSCGRSNFLRGDRTWYDYGCHVWGRSSRVGIIHKGDFERI